ncbi:Protein DMP2 [Cardamine amara subsp. amara]|uniref:Protein DMP2 n=1 Tax=Cardamine amara subsp. amara TaxID=228776 RepID=A0ABD0ZS74_CARAN
MSKTFKAIRDRTYSGVGDLIKLLPTGTVFLFQFLNPVLTNNGHCLLINKYLTGALIVVCAFSCCFTCFTDSYRTRDGNVHYGVVTVKGLWPDSSSVDLSSYRLKVGDFVHAFFSLIVFSVISLLDANTVNCFYPGFGSTGKIFLMVLPPVIGVISGVVFTVFPSRRHGIGNPSENNEDDASEREK